MEQLIQIQTSKQYSVVGRLRGEIGGRPLVVFLHGLGSNMDHHLFFNGARWFDKKGYISFRFNFYSGNKDGRQMKQGTLESQVADVESVVKHFIKQGVKKVFLVGHSYGGLTLLLANRLMRKDSVKGVSVWDASFDPYTNEFKDMVYVPAVKGYVFKRAFDVILGKSMVEEAKKLDCVVLGKNIKKPLQIICSEKGKVIFGNELYYQNARGPKEFTVMKGVGHNFHEDGLEEKLFKKTYTWFKKFI